MSVYGIDHACTSVTNDLLQICSAWLMKSKTLCVILGESELIKYLNFWNCGNRVKSGSIVMTLTGRKHKVLAIFYMISLLALPVLLWPL